MRKTYNDEFEKQKKLDQMGVTSTVNPAQNQRTSAAALAKQMGIQRSTTQGQPAQNRSFSRLTGAQQGSMQNQVQKQPLIGKPIQAGSPVQTGAAPNSQWQQKMDGVIDKIMNREDFKYDLNGDAFYQQYKDQYTQQGKMAMMDTMGQAAALTGGYGSSYAQNAGQQAYQGYLQNLNDKVPELYQLALDTYQREGDNLYQQYSMLSDRDNQEYSRYQDQRDFGYQQQRDQVADAKDQRDYDRSVWESDRDFGYQQQRDAVGDQQWQDQFDADEEQRGIDNDFRQQQYNRSVWESDRDFGYQQQRDAVGDQQWQAQYASNEEQRGIDNDYREKVYGLDYQKYLADLDETENGGGVSGIYSPVIDAGADEVAQDFKTAVNVGTRIQPYKDVPAATKSGSESLKYFNNAVGSRSGTAATRGMKPQTGGNNQTAMPQAKETDNAKKFASGLMTKEQAARRGLSGANYEAWVKQQINSSNLSPEEALWALQYYGYDL